jgi:hypothetical protein
MADSSFIYKDFVIAPDTQTVSFTYVIRHDDTSYQLSEQLAFPLPLTESNQMQAALRALHLALGISYYKTFMSPTIEHPYAMAENEATFWNDVWRNGLGEFLYINKLDPNKLARFTAQAGTDYPHASAAAPLEPTVLLGIGGGKDSIVSGELLKQLNLPFSGFVMATGEQLGQTKAVAETMDIPLFAIGRKLDTRLLELQELPDAYKGHVPISLIFGLVGTVLAIASGANYVAVGNEASASIPRIRGAFGNVNHQWSKSFAFEEAFQSFVHQHISPDITYFSTIRPLTSVGVAKLFSQHSKYFTVFTSDNSVFRIDPAKRPNARWSLESPKTLSSFILLAPWLSEADLMSAFGRNMLAESMLETLFLELTGQQGEPPLDCVGTIEELTLSLRLLVSQKKFVGSTLLDTAQRRGMLDVSDKELVTQLHAMLELQFEQAFPRILKDKLIALLQMELKA